MTPASSLASSTLAHEDTRSSRRAFALGALLVLAVVLAFGSSLRHAFIYWDDNNGIFENADLNPPKVEGLVKFWTGVRQGYRGFYVPVLYTVWWSAAHVARVPVPSGSGIIAHADTMTNPAVFHGLSLAFHAGGAVLAFLLLRRLVKADWAALFGAAIFALHPLQADPVNWASNMYTPLSGMLAFAAIYLHFRFTDARQRGRMLGAWLTFAGATLFYTAALLTKPTIILLPAIVLLLEVFLRGRRLRACWPLLIWCVLGLADGLITRHTQTFPEVMVPALWKRPFIASDALAFYLSKLFLPVGLVNDYSRSPEWSLNHRWMWFTWLLPAGIALVCWRKRRTAPWLWVSAAVLLFGVAPTLGLTPFDYQMFSTVADRYMYFSLFGAAIAGAFLCQQALAARSECSLDSVRTVMKKATALSWRIVVPALGLCLVLAVLSRVQTGYWQDTRTLFTHNIDVNPDSIVAHRQLAFMLLVRNNPADREEAVKHYEIALKLHPNDPGVVSNLGLLLMRTGHPDDAVWYFLLAVQMRPDRGPVYENLGNGLLACGEMKGAATAYRQALQRMPELAPTQLRQAELLVQSGHPEMAVPHYQAVLAVHPDWEPARIGLDRAMKLKTPKVPQGQANIASPE